MAVPDLTRAAVLAVSVAAGRCLTGAPVAATGSAMLWAVCLLGVAGAPASAQHVPRVLSAQRAPAFTMARADSILVGRILLAEDRRDSTDAALAQGARHPDERVRQLARRARLRIRDAHAAPRDSMAVLPVPRMWPEPSWKPAYRSLVAPTTTSCPVEGRSAALMGPMIGSLMGTLPIRL